MKLNRKLFFKIHSWIGIKLSILFFIVCFSGTLATLSHEMDWLFIPEMRVEEKEEFAPKNEIANNIQKAFPNGRIEYWGGSEEPYLCDIVYIQNNGERIYGFVNPHTGELQGSARLTFQRFFRDLHYFLFIPFQVGHFTVLMFAFLLFISFITALLFYKKWYQKLFQLEIKKGGIVFFRSLHRLVGVWSVPFTLLFSITGLWYFAERTNIGGISDIANPKTPVITNPIEVNQDNENSSYSIDYDMAIAEAKMEIPSLKVMDIIPSKNRNQALYINGKSDVPLVRNRANRVYVNPANYEVVGVQKASSIGIVTWLNDIADPLHFGTWGGLLTKIIWFIFGLGISSLILSGIWISLKRKVKNKAKRKAQQMGKWKFINWLIYGTMLGFMYYSLITRYHLSVYGILTISIGWLVFIGLAWYIFSYRLRKSMK